jgi:hypothetical protein
LLCASNTGTDTAANPETYRTHKGTHSADQSTYESTDQSSDNQVSNPGANNHTYRHTDGQRHEWYKWDKCNKREQCHRKCWTI